MPDIPNETTTFFDDAVENLNRVNKPRQGKPIVNSLHLSEQKAVAEAVRFTESLRALLQEKQKNPKFELINELKKLNDKVDSMDEAVRKHESETRSAKKNIDVANTTLKTLGNMRKLEGYVPSKEEEILFKKANDMLRQSKEQLSFQEDLKPAMDELRAEAKRIREQEIKPKDRELSNFSQKDELKKVIQQQIDKFDSPNKKVKDLVRALGDNLIKALDASPQSPKRKM